MACFAALCLGQQRGWWDVSAAEQSSDGHIYHLRGHAELKGHGVVLRADAIDYDEDKAVVHLTGHVSIEANTVSVHADEVVYDINSGDIRLKVKEAATEPAAVAPLHRSLEEQMKFMKRRMPPEIWADNN
jgi:lipopolysaccharide assembly outer membrane protein LptD (OstA)